MDNIDKLSKGLGLNAQLRDNDMNGPQTLA